MPLLCSLCLTHSLWFDPFDIWTFDMGTFDMWTYDLWTLQYLPRYYLLWSSYNHIIDAPMLCTLVWLERCTTPSLWYDLTTALIWFVYRGVWMHPRFVWAKAILIMRLHMQISGEVVVCAIHALTTLGASYSTHWGIPSYFVWYPLRIHGYYDFVYLFWPGVNTESLNLWWPLNLW